MHAAQQLIDHLHLRALTGLVAQHEYARTERGQHRANPLDHFGRTAHHHGERSLLRADLAARDRCVDQMDLLRGQAHTKLAHILRRHRAARNEDRARSQHRGKSVLAEKHILGLGIVDHEAHDDVTGRRQIGGPRGDRAPFRQQPGQRFGIDIPPDDVESLGQEV